MGVDEKRRFSPTRLYKLTAAIVILVTIFCFYGAQNNFKTYYEYNLKSINKFGDCWTQYWNNVDAGKPSNIDKWNWRNQHKNDPIALQQKNWCMVEPNVYFTTSTTAHRNYEIEQEIAIFLPLLFFGGTILYIFIFPKNKK